MDIVEYLTFLQSKWPKKTWQDYYNDRRRTGGNHRAAILYANMSVPDEAQPVPADDPRRMPPIQEASDGR